MIYTIGYATKPIDLFIKQLQQYAISAVCDVRSVPFSKRFFDYHQDAIRQHLNNAQIRYVYLGEELGPRSRNPDHYDACNQVQFEKLMQSDNFLNGLKRLKNGIEQGFTLALMCAEKDPATCHRSLLIGYAVARLWDDELMHINHQGELEAQTQLEQRLKHMHGFDSDLFASEADLLLQAYRKQLKATSYIKPTAVDLQSLK